ncbi:MAG: hypothetical protein AB1510_12910 [Bacillota bacterium]
MLVENIENAGEFVVRIQEFGERTSCDSECLSFTVRDYSGGHERGPVWVEVCVKDVGNVARGEDLKQVWLGVRFGEGWQEPARWEISDPVEWVYEHRQGVNEYLVKHAADSERQSLCKIGKKVRVIKKTSPFLGQVGTTRRVQSVGSPGDTADCMYEVQLAVPREQYEIYKTRENFDGYVTPWFFKDDLEFIER